MDMGKLQFRLEDPNHPESVCSKPCVDGQAQTFIKGDICCWTCINCSKYQYLPNRFNCKDCPMGSLPSYDKSYCMEIAEIYLHYNDGIAVGAMVFSTVGIIATLFVSAVFLR